MKPSCLTLRSPTPATATPRQQRRGHPYSPCSSNRQYPSDYLEQLPIDYLVRSQAQRMARVVMKVWRVIASNSWLVPLLFGLL